MVDIPPLTSGHARSASFWRASAANRASIQPSALHLSRSHWVERTLRLELRAKPQVVVLRLGIVCTIECLVYNKERNNSSKNELIGVIYSRRKSWRKYGGAKHFCITIPSHHHLVFFYFFPKVNQIIWSTHRTTTPNLSAIQPTVHKISH